MEGALVELRAQRPYLDEVGSGEKACGQENVVGAAVHGNLLHIFKGELREVDLPCLTVGYGQTVVRDGGMLTAEAAHGNGLHAAHTAVVLDDDAGEEFEHVGKQHGGHRLDVRLRNGLYGYGGGNCAPFRFPLYGNTLQKLHGCVDLREIFCKEKRKNKQEEKLFPHFSSLFTDF